MRENRAMRDFLGTLTVIPWCLLQCTVVQTNNKKCFKLLTFGFELWTLIFGLRSLTQCIRHFITGPRPKLGKFKQKQVKFKHYSIVLLMQAQKVIKTLLSLKFNVWNPKFKAQISNLETTSYIYFFKFTKTGEFKNL